MGSDILLRQAEICKIHYYIIGQTDKLKVYLIKNNEEYRIDETDNGIIEANIEEIPPVGENFYYLRVVQDNNERAWSTPIWIKVEK